MTSRRHVSRLAALAIGLAANFATIAAAQDFYRGRTLTILVGFTPGGGFDINARLLARHIGRHIPGRPAVVVQNMPGAAGLNSILYLDSVAPKDGTVIDTFNFGQIGDSRLAPEKIKVDFRRFNWIGSISQDLTVCYLWHTVGPKNLAELKGFRPLNMGLTAVGSSSDVNQRILRDIFGVKLRQVAGYPGSAEERLAIERGELDGDCGAWSSLPVDWIEGKKIFPVIRSAPYEAPNLPPGVPYSADIAPTERDRQVIRLLTASGQVGRPFIAALGVPSERVAILRQAFDATVHDEAFVAEAHKLRLPVSPKNAEEAMQVVEAIYSAPDDIVAAAKKIAGE